jgi:hypothetical protein
MIRAKTDVEGPIVSIKIEAVETGLREDPMRNLERPSLENAEVNTLTQARTEGLSILIQFATSMLIPVKGYIRVGIFVDQFVKCCRRNPAQVAIIRRKHPKDRLLWRSSTPLIRS